MQSAYIPDDLIRYYCTYYLLHLPSLSIFGILTKCIIRYIFRSMQAVKCHALLYARKRVQKITLPAVRVQYCIFE